MVHPVCEVFLTDARIAAPEETVPAETGAVMDFWGVVRGLEGDAEITGIDYEANRTMAEHQLRAIAGEATRTFELKQIVICHRIGFVAVGEASLLVRVGTGHRAAAFRAIEAVVDELKQRAPIWKHPQFRAGASTTQPNEKSSLKELPVLSPP